MYVIILCISSIASYLGRYRSEGEACLISNAIHFSASFALRTSDTPSAPEARNLVEDVFAGLKRAFSIVVMGQVGRGNIDGIAPAHNLGFWYEPAGNPAGTDDPNLADILRLRTELCAGDTLGAWQIDHLAVLIQVVELSLPVGPDSEDIDIILLDIVDLLTYIVFDDDLIGISGCFDVLDTLQDIVPDV